MTAQDNWRWCNKCQALAYAGFPTLGACAAGGSHDHSGSGDYVLIEDVPAGGNEQDNWKWCNKCQALAYAGGASLGACAAGGVHNHLLSGDYVLTYSVAAGGNQQDDWKWCNKCQALAYAGSPLGLGACAVGGVHDHSGSGDYLLSFE